VLPHYLYKKCWEYYLGNVAKPDFWLYIFNKWKYVSEIMLNLFAWNYFCLNLNLGNGNVKLFAKNEIQIANHSLQELVNNVNVSLSSLWINMEVISLLNIHSNMVRETHSCGAAGNLLAWSGYTWRQNENYLNSMIKETYIPVDHICEKNDHYVLFPVQLKRQDAVKACSKIGT
jgi:hypothetical protein